MRTLLDDPVYANGVQSESINSMLDDISKAASGNGHHIRVPLPITGIAPMQAMHYKVPSDMYVKDLVIKPIGSSRATVSRRSMAYSISGNSQVSSAYSYRTNVDIPDEDIDIDDVMNMVTSSNIEDNEDSVVPDEDSDKKTPDPRRYTRRRGRLSSRAGL